MFLVMVSLSPRMGRFSGVLCPRVTQGEILKHNIPLVAGQTGVYLTEY